MKCTKNPQNINPNTAKKIASALILKLTLISSVVSTIDVGADVTVSLVGGTSELSVGNALIVGKLELGAIVGK
jgi:hypothetical protein